MTELKKSIDICIRFTEKKAEKVKTAYDILSELGKSHPDIYEKGIDVLMRETDIPEALKARLKNIIKE